MSAPFFWEPTPDYVERANVTRLMRRHGIDDYWELVSRSQQDTEWFWGAVVDDLGIEFSTPYSQVLDDSEGPQWPRWFLGGAINLTHNCVDRHAGGSGIAVTWEGEEGATRSLSYADLLAEVSRAANGLKQLGIGKGDAVGVYMPMVPEAVIAAYAAARIGAIYLPIFSGFGAPAVAARLEDAGARVLVTADGFYRRGQRVPMRAVADEAAARVRSVERVVVFERFGDAEAPGGDKDVTWDEAFGSQPDDCEPVALDPETPFLIAYTSGTTGRPKGSVHVHGGFLVKIAEEVAYQADVSSDDVLYWVTDMGWIMGPWQVVGGHAAGATVVMYEGAPNHPGPDRVWDVCARHGVTVLGTSPTLVRAQMPAGEDAVRAHDLSRLRILASTGEPWNPEPYRWLAEVVGGSRRPIINISGGTEVGACFLGQTPVVPTKSCSLGSPALGMAIDVYGPDGRPVRGEVGELVCTKPWPSQTRGFWGNRERYLETYWSRWDDVWVHGDWASVDTDGFWFLHGRSDDTLNVAGKRIGPAEFESAAVDHPAVVECAAIGIPDDVKGTAVWCFCILRSDRVATDELRAEITEVITNELGKAFKPAEIRFVEELPKTRSAKILRRAIRARVMDENPGDLSSLENPGALEAIDKALS
ncbi:MAG: AMP-binding protein [Actinomycetota bacterium]